KILPTQLQDYKRSLFPTTMHNNRLNHDKIIYRITQGSEVIATIINFDLSNLCYVLCYTKA
ncbi:unnamed protein product, partial [Rotaria socialis]